MTDAITVVPVESALCSANTYFNTAHLIIWYIHHPRPLLRDTSSAHPLPACATSSPPLHPLPRHVGRQGRAGGQTCQSKYHRHAAAPQTPITTQQGRGLATAWQPHGPIRVHNNGDQRRPRKVNEAVCPRCARVRVFELSKTEPERVRDWQETSSHCVFLISVSCLFSADFQFKLELISINLLITRVALIKDTVLTCTIISSPMIQKKRLNWKLTHLTAINMLGWLVLMTHYMTIKKKKFQLIFFT